MGCFQVFLLCARIRKDTDCRLDGVIICRPLFIRAVSLPDLFCLADQVIECHPVLRISGDLIALLHQLCHRCSQLRCVPILFFQGLHQVRPVIFDLLAPGVLGICAGVIDFCRIFQETESRCCFVSIAFAQFKCLLCPDQTVHRFIYA